MGGGLACVLLFFRLIWVKIWVLFWECHWNWLGGYRAGGNLPLIKFVRLSCWRCSKSPKRHRLTKESSTYLQAMVVVVNCNPKFIASMALSSFGLNSSKPISMSAAASERSLSPPSRFSRELFQAMPWPQINCFNQRHDLPPRPCAPVG